MAVAARQDHRWLMTLGWLVGLILFIRWTQILPCCQPRPLDEVLRAHECRAGLDPCPHYDDCVPR